MQSFSNFFYFFFVAGENPDNSESDYARLICDRADFLVVRGLDGSISIPSFCTFRLIQVESDFVKYLQSFCYEICLIQP